MALPAATAPFVMLLLLVLVPTGCSDQGGGGGGGCFAPLIACAAPAPTASATGNATVFRASLAPLLAALPSAAAAEGFAALRSQPGPGRDRAHALGLCFGFGFGGGGEDDASDCHACLRTAVAAATEGCANDTRRAGVWSDGCLLAYYADDAASSSYADGGLEQTLADLAMALAQPMPQSLWRKAQSITLFVLAAIGAVTVVVLACFLVGCYLLAETLFGNMAAPAAGPQGDGVALYIAGTNGQAHVWSMATQFRFH